MRAGWIFSELFGIVQEPCPAARTKDKNSPGCTGRSKSQDPVLPHIQQTQLLLQIYRPLLMLKQSNYEHTMKVGHFQW